MQLARRMSYRRRETHESWPTARLSETSGWRRWLDPVFRQHNIYPSA